MRKTEELLNKLIDTVNALKIAGYIKEEAIASLKYLHWYKLKNIDKNLLVFCEYLEFLNIQNTDKIEQLCIECSNNSGYGKKQDLDYFFVSEKKLTKKLEKAYFQKIKDNGYEFLTLIQGMKGLLVLSIDEFCNASQTRMGIHKLLMQRNPEYEKLCKKKRKTDL